ncbi:Methyltransferase-like 26 [Seminavis robusta]|uniref:Methyltransferase-like 26 n=1 Tax=Seminavis robusta TaxID=568900 RepID=A0A9N8H239_9STRA|nr:Methyltransferase-like 26 [Seminavis robusta]|eukprot:Sro29_g018940.1 Methyltransferase-like 26 (217) ;mRNA; r:1202-1960
MAKRDSPSAQRNKEPIWNMLSAKVLPAIPKKDEPLRVLEIAAGCGVHSHHFSLQLDQTKTPFLWYPSDPEESSRASIQAYLDDEPTLKDKLQSPIDVTLHEDGPTDPNLVNGLTFDLCICINMIHISPWSATLGLMNLAGNKLSSGGILFLYGPYKVNGSAVESNLRFDMSLRSRDPSWGVRNLEDVFAAAEKCGLEHVETIEMPANNLSVILRKK